MPAAVTVLAPFGCPFDLRQPLEIDQRMRFVRRSTAIYHGPVGCQRLGNKKIIRADLVTN